MSTSPTELLSTAATEPALDIASIKELMDGFDPAALLPGLQEVFGSLAQVCRVAVIIGPVIMLVLGLSYLFLSPKEANYYFGYRCYFGMGSVKAWQFTQRLAGLTLSILGFAMTVAMVLISGGFAAMDVMDMAWKTVACLVLQAGLALLATIVINFSAAVRFDRRGQYRRRSRKNQK